MAATLDVRDQTSVVRNLADRRAIAVAGVLAAAAGVVACIAPVPTVLGVVAVAVGIVVVRRPVVAAAALAVTVPLEQVTVGGLSSNRAGAALAVAAIAAQVLLRGGVRRPAAVAPVAAGAAFVALAVASGTWTHSWSGTAYQLGSLLLAVVYVVGFALLVRTSADVELVLASATVASVAVAAWWIASFAAGVDRFENPAGDPNRTAMHLIMAIAFALALAAGRRTATARAAMTGVAGLLVAGTAATLSRGGALAIAVVAVAVAVLPAQSLFRSARDKRAVAATFGLALVASLAVVGPQLLVRFQERPEGSEVTGTRGDLWAAAWRTSADHPIAGIGFGAFRPESYDLLRETPGVSLTHHVPEALAEGRYVHDVYLEALVELGPAGVLAFVALLATTATTAWRVARRSPPGPVRAAAAACVVSLAGYATASLFLSTSTARALALIVGITLALTTVPTDTAPTTPEHP